MTDDDHHENQVYSGHDGVLEAEHDKPGRRGPFINGVNEA
jgi:hypothetical protein